MESGTRRLKCLAASKLDDSRRPGHSLSPVQLTACRRVCSAARLHAGVLFRAFETYRDVDTALLRYSSGNARHTALLLGELPLATGVGSSTIHVNSQKRLSG